VSGQIWHLLRAIGKNFMVRILPGFESAIKLLGGRNVLDETIDVITRVCEVEHDFHQSLRGRLTDDEKLTNKYFAPFMPNR
jgi:hypothetical protein